MNIEQKAAAKVIDVISSSDYLEPQISVGDKGVSWDGFINVYNKSGDVHEKDSLYKSIRVQVKGKKASKVTEKSISYSVQIADLRNYLTEGGTVFFVVYINNETNEFQIYFKRFLPVDIKPILKKYGKQKRRNVEFTPFPSDKGRITELFINVAANIKKQLPFIEEEIITLEELEKNGKPINVIVSYASVLSQEKSVLDAFFDYEQYVYVKNANGVDIPAGKRKFDYKEKVINEPVSVNELTFYDKYTLRETKEEFIYIFGGNVYLKHKKGDGANAVLEFELSGGLKQRLTDAEFIYAFITEHNLMINGRIVVDSISYSNGNNVDEGRLYRHICWLRDVKKMLEAVSFQREFRYDNVSSEDVGWLQLLVDCFVYGKRRKLQCDGIGLTNINVAGHCLKFFIKHTNIGGEAYSICNFNKLNGRCERRVADGNVYPISMYSLLTKTDLLTCENIDHVLLLEETKRVSLSEVLAWDMNRLLLDMLTVYDESGDSRADLLDAAYKLAEWLCGNVNIIPKEISVLNFYQVVKRKRTLTDDENNQLLQLMESPDLPLPCKMAIHLLLGEQLSARRYFMSLSSEQQEEYKKMPIFRFWQGK